MTRTFAAKCKQRGNVSLIFALSSLGLVGMMGGTVEVVRVVDTKAKLQSIVDAAALAAFTAPANASESTRRKLIEDVFQANLISLKGLESGKSRVTADFGIPGEVLVSGSVGLSPVFNVGIFKGAHSINANATALAATPAVASTSVCVPTPTPTDVALQAPPPAPPPPPAVNNGCVWAVSGSIGAAFSGSLMAPTCDFHANKDASFAGQRMSVNAVFAKGSAGGAVNGGVGPHPWAFPKAGDRVQGDPFPTGLPQPSSTTKCDYNDMSKALVTDLVLDPGVYCGTTGLAVAGGKITFKPGLYVFRNGGLSIASTSVDATNGVTMFFDNATLGLALSGTFKIQAPTTGPYAGMAMYERYDHPAVAGWSVANGSGVEIDGLLYFPKRSVGLAASASTKTQRFRLVAQTVSFAGTNWNIEPSTVFPPGVTPLTFSTPAVAAVPPVSTATNLLPNGSFETKAISVGGNVFGVDLPSIPNWTTTGMFEYFNSRFTSNGAGFGTDGVQYAELSTNLSQAVNTIAGKTYEINFDYRYGDNGSAEDNEIQVVWNDSLIATLSPPNPTATPTEWKRISLPVIASGSSATFTLRQFARANPNNGASIDRVRIFENAALVAPNPGCPGGPPALPPRAATMVRLKS